MKVAIVVPGSERALMHRVRGSGVYASNLTEALKRNYPNDSFVVCTSKNIPQADITHFLYFEPFFRTLPIFKKNKTVVTVHDLIPFVFPKNFPIGIKGNMKWQVQRFALNNCDAIITDSEASKKDIERYAGVGENKINVVYLAAGDNFRKKSKASNIRKKYGLPDKFVLYVGDVTWNKNLPRLMEAALEKGLPLVMVGKALITKNFDRKNPWNQDLLKVQKIAKNKNIFILGFIEDNDLIDLYNSARVFAMPSLYEGFGLPVIEAMSCGCPVVTSKKGSLEEIAGNAAYYVDPYSKDSIAKGVSEVFFNNSLNSKLSQKGLEEAERFSWRKTAGDTHSVYKKLL